MSATARPARDLAATRDKLTAALAEFFGTEVTPLDVRAGAALLPVVAEAIADELDAAADGLFDPREAAYVRARAADIREKAGRP